MSDKKQPNRRQFLQRSALAAAGVALLPGKSLTGSLTIVRGSPKRVVILGAGLAGMVAGYELSQLGHNVTILEARMRSGGRVHTLREPFSDGLFAEAGAARIPDDHDLTLKYLKLFDVPLEPMYPTRLSAVRLDGGPRRLVGPEGFTEALGKNFGDELGGNPARWSKIPKPLPNGWPKRFSTARRSCASSRTRTARAQCFFMAGRRKPSAPTAFCARFRFRFCVGLNCPRVSLRSSETSSANSNTPASLVSICNRRKDSGKKRV
jgi:hypothetical protein